MVKVIGPLASHWASGTMTAPTIISSSLRNRHARIAPEPGPTPPPPPEADLEVTGTLNPDVTGLYDEAGIHDGRPYYKHQDAEWYIIYEFDIIQSKHIWYISPVAAVPTTLGWFIWPWVDQPAPGLYYPLPLSTGVATVAEP